MWQFYQAQDKPPYTATQYSADWLIVETAGMQRHHITMQQLEPSLHQCSGDLHQCSSTEARLCNGSGGSFEFNEVLCLCRCQVDFQLRLSEVCWC